MPRAVRLSFSEADMRHINIPIFIPHMGCPNNCVFCNQRSISGCEEFDVSDVRRQIEEALSTVGADDECEIAFFGGSFTGIERSLMISLLSLAKEYIDRGKVESIRLSTRPDYINEEILDILSRYSVRTVELGLQSMDDEVLSASKRGHNSECAERACVLVRQRGFELIGQMMIGLPCSDPEKEIYTAKKLCELSVDGVRVYPTVVFYETELCDMARAGAYEPLALDDAVERCAEVLDVFDKAGVPCIRVGLCASENLSDPEKVYGGAAHSALGELAMGELFYKRMCQSVDMLSSDIMGKKMIIYVARGAVSKATGQKRRNVLRLCERYALSSVKIKEDGALGGYELKLEIQG